MPLGEAIWIGARDWLPWVILTPLLCRLCGRIPIERENWKLSLPVHVIAVTAAMFFCAGAANLISMAHRSVTGNSFFDFRSFPHPSSGEKGAPPPSDGPHFPSRPSRFFGLFIIIGFRLPIYITSLSIAHAVHFYQRSKERERRALELTARLAQSRLEALKTQLQPHFLFNTLNSIAELVHRDAEAADSMIASLSDLLRLTLETANEQELPLRRELQFVERYLAIEQIRFGERLRLEMDIAADTREALVPAFLLQPLLENALRHGLEPQSASGLLTIRAARESSILRLQIIDNGRGLSKDQPLREGIGLSNTRARLSALYGESAKLEMRDGGGLAVEILLPFRIAS